MQVTEMFVSELIPYADNPRNISQDAVEKVANSIREFGFQQPIVVDKDNIIIVGHTRYLASKKLNLRTVPVVVADNLSDEQVKAYRLADNKTGEISEWDFPLLEDELSALNDFCMDRFGFEQFEELDVPDDDDNAEEQYFVEVRCEDSDEAGELFMMLASDGHNCQIKKKKRKN